MPPKRDTVSGGATEHSTQQTLARRRRFTNENTRQPFFVYRFVTHFVYAKFLCTASRTFCEPLCVCEIFVYRFNQFCVPLPKFLCTRNFCVRDMFVYAKFCVREIFVYAIFLCTRNFVYAKFLCTASRIFCLVCFSLRRRAGLKSDTPATPRGSRAGAAHLERWCEGAEEVR